MTDRPIGGEQDPWGTATQPPSAPPPTPREGGGGDLPFAPSPDYVPTTERPAPNLPPAGPWPAPPQAGGWNTAPPPYDQGYGHPGYGHPGYGQPGYGYGYPVTPQHDKGATRALVLGIISLVICGLILGGAAVYEGSQARKRIHQSNGALTGDGMALAGMILGVLGIASTVIILIFTFSSSGGR